MAGSILGADQVAKVNNSYPRLRAHVEQLFFADSTPYGQMKVHFLTEYLDTTEIAAVFKDLPFLSPAEKRSLVRMVIYDVLTGKVSYQAPAPVLIDRAPAPMTDVYTPKGFNLNVNRSAEFHGQTPKDTQAAAPVVTSTHKSISAQMLDNGAKAASAEQLARDSAAQVIRDTPAEDVK